MTNNLYKKIKTSYYKVVRRFLCYLDLEEGTTDVDADAIIKQLTILN